VIAAAEAGPAEIVEHERSGLLVEPGRPDLLADAICRLLADAPLRERLVRGGLERARTFTADVTANRFAGLIDDVSRVHR
jgi:glycosyltransferase involved in cell wall biosynthesis